MNKHVIPPTLLAIRPQIETHLRAIGNLVPEEYRQTLVMRHTALPDAYLVVTDDYPLEDVATTLMRSDLEDKKELGPHMHLKSTARDAVRKILFEFETKMHGYRHEPLSQADWQTKAHKLLDETVTKLVAREEAAK